MHGSKNVLLTGGAGFLGSLLKEKLLALGFNCISIDLQPDSTQHPHLTTIQENICNLEQLEQIFKEHTFDAILHCAAILAHDAKDKNFLWASNVEGTRNIAHLAKKYSVPKIIFTSSNCLWAKNFHRPVLEEDMPDPVEIYGKSKWEGEKILLNSNVTSIIFRCPTIIDSGRLGLLAILFEFINENKKVWLVGKGDNQYQFIYAQDLIDAFFKALSYPTTEIFNIGSDKVTSLGEIYNYVIQKANSKARVASLPRKPTLLAMKLCHKLKISPLGPYQYKMIAESFTFDTSKIKQKLNWQPTLTNQEMLYKAYEYYQTNRNEIDQRTNVAAHKRPAKMGIIRVLKWLS
jgi:Nucleoside-diphosphate-sugar epimerases